MTALTLLAIGVVVACANMICGCGPGDDARNQSYELARSCDIFKLQHGRVPLRLDELIHPPLTHKPIMQQLPLDPWGNAYGFVVPGLRNPHAFDVVSAGEDGRFFTADDSGNWAIDSR